jgi:hypothetical protein
MIALQDHNANIIFAQFIILIFDFDFDFEPHPLLLATISENHWNRPSPPPYQKYKGTT